MRQQTFEEFTESKIAALQHSTFYEGKHPTELELHRVEILIEHLQEYREKRARGWLEIEKGGVI